MFRALLVPENDKSLLFYEQRNGSVQGGVSRG